MLGKEAVESSARKITQGLKETGRDSLDLLKGMDGITRASMIGAGALTTVVGLFLTTGWPADITPYNLTLEPPKTPEPIGLSNSYVFSDSFSGYIRVEEIRWLNDTIH